MQSTNSPDWVDYFFRTLPILMVVLGWYLVNRQNNNRETRKEVRTALDKLTVSLVNLSNHSREFHTQKFSVKEQLSLLTEIQRVIDKTEFIASFLDVDISNNCTDLRQSITSKNFDKTEHTPLDDTDELLTNIDDCAYDIESILEKAYVEEYRK